jgi:hypothetical protein
MEKAEEWERGDVGYQEDRQFSRNAMKCNESKFV